MSAASRAKHQLRIEQMLTGLAGGRDYRVAKRQPLAVMRADDIDDMDAMWARITFPSMRRLFEFAAEVHDGLAVAGHSRVR